MRHFELVAILSPMLNQDEASATWDDIKSFISNREGEITAEQVWGTRRLAYPIRKGNYNFLEGAYYLSSFAVENVFNRELETYLRLDDRVLRSLVVRCDGPMGDIPAPGPLTAPSRYIPPGRGRRTDGGGPVPDVPGGPVAGGPIPQPATPPPAVAEPAPVEPSATAPESVAAEPSADAPESVAVEPSAVAPESVAVEPAADAPESVAVEPAADAPESVAAESAPVAEAAVAEPEPVAVEPAPVDEPEPVVEPPVEPTAESDAEAEA